MQGIVVTGLSYWLQLWAVEKKGPLFAASFTPLILLFTALLSAALWNDTLYVGRFLSLDIYHHHFLNILELKLMVLF